MKKSLLLVFILTLFLSSCMTKSLWNDTRLANYTDYIESIYINPQDNSLIFIGKKYHYIFKENKKFSYLFKNFDKNTLFYMKKGTYSAKDDTITASFSANIKTNKKAKEWMKQNNYPVYVDSIVNIDLKGTRYKPDLKINKIAQKLTKVYKIRVKETKSSSMPTIVKVILTPLSVVGDTVVMSGVALVMLSSYYNGIAYDIFFR